MQQQIKLPILPGEEWWGGLITDGFQMPYPQGFTRTMHDLGGNSAMPVLLSNRGRSLWCDSPFQFTLQAQELIVEAATPVSLYNSGLTLRDGFLEVSAAHFPPSGVLPDLLLFTIPQYNTWIEMTYFATQQRVLAYAEGILEHGFPPGVLMLDTLWHPVYGNWRFDGERFPDPQAMVARLHELGFKVMLWVCPYVSADTLIYRELRERDYLLRRSDGQMAIGEWWDGYSAVLDLLNPMAVAWLHERLDELITNVGVDGFKFDGGQPEFFASLAVEHPHNYTRAWNEVGLRYRLAEYKDSWRSGGWPLMQRIRDRYHTWDDTRGLGSLIPLGIAQGLLGYSFNCPDMIGGGEYKDFPLEGAVSSRFDAELFVRSAQCSALFPMMQFSAAPWRVLDETHLGYCRDAALLHTRLGSTIHELARQASVSGEPIMRHLAYVYPDMGYEHICDQFLLGNDILVAPVLTKGATSRRVVFPPGQWGDEQGAIVEGPCVQEVAAPLARLPWYRKL